MMLRRHGRRAALSLALLIACGCGGATTPSPDRTTRPPLASVPNPIANDEQLDPPSGSRAAVEEIVWGGRVAPRCLGVLWTDGRFAIRRPGDTRPGNRCVSPPGSRAVRALAVVGPRRAITGDETGLTLWDTSKGSAIVIGKSDSGPITALAIDDSQLSHPSLIAGDAAGRLHRYRIEGDRLDRPVREADTGASDPITRIVVHASDRAILSLRRDGTLWRSRMDLTGEPVPMGSARGLAVDAHGPRIARLVDGPAVGIEAETSPRFSAQFLAPAPVRSLALAEVGDALILGLNGKALVIGPVHRMGSKALWRRELTGFRGSVVVAADPLGHAIAIGDGSGRIRLLPPGTIRTIGRPTCLDDAPDLAFRPEMRFDRPRPGSPESEIGADLKRRIESARNRLQREELTDLADELHRLAGLSDLPPDVLGEVLAMEAARLQRAGESATTIARSLDAASTAFAQGHVPDREADMELWQGLLKVRPTNREDRPMVVRSSTSALPHLARSASLYREAGTRYERQAILAQAARARVLLDSGELRDASRAMADVSRAQSTDPVLGNVLELDCIALGLASRRLDWPRVASIAGRLLDRLGPSAPALARDLALRRAFALAALGRWPEAAEVLGGDRPADAEWTLRRAASRLAAGRAVTVPANLPADSPLAAHLRAMIATHQEKPSESHAIDSDLRAASQGHRLAGRNDLAVEADLALSENLEREGRRDDAAQRFLSVIRELRTLTEDDGVGMFRPVSTASGRAMRGLARTETRRGGAARALAAIEAARRTPLAAVPGAGRSDIVAFGLPGSEFPMLESLAEACAKRAEKGNPGLDEPAGVEIRRLRAALAGHDAGRISLDPLAGVDAAGLKLENDEAILVFGVAGPDSLLGVLVRPSGEPVARPLPIGRRDASATIRQWRASLGDGGRRIAQAREETACNFLGLGREPDLPDRASLRNPPAGCEARLHDGLFRPFESHLKGVNRLFLVSETGLEGMPLEIVGRESRLLERVSVGYLPDSASLPVLRDDQRVERPASHSALIVAPEASGAVDALVASNLAAGLKTEVRRGPQASPSRLLGERLSGYSVVHFVARCAGDASRSLSGEVELRLHPGDAAAGSDGRLSESDLASIPLRARLVVLEIGDRTEGDPEALFRMARAGLLAGADSVLLTLWEPPAESASIFFAELYLALQRGSSTRQAVAGARAAIGRDPRFRDPVHWAGYIYFGL